MSSAMETINDIFREFGKEYIKSRKLSVRARKVIHDILFCRTEALGGRTDKCDNCGYVSVYYNSCRNRHCPQCQFIKKEEWILAKQKDILPFQYFHAVFTLPDKLNPIVIRNKKLIYTLLFQSVKQTLLSVSSEDKYLGAKIGFFSILHTWGQKLNLHPHLHCVIPGGGYSEKKNKWISCSKDYLLPIEVLRVRFRSIFLTNLKKILINLYLSGTLYNERHQFQRLIDNLFKCKWVCYIKESFKSSDSVIRYLAKYTHRIALSNNRIFKIEDRKVTFIYKDYADGNKKKLKTLDVFKFMNKFLLHVVPYRFVRIRYYGILSHRNKKKEIEACREYFNIESPIKKHSGDMYWKDIYLEITGKDISKCPVCGEGNMMLLCYFDKPPPGFARICI